MSAPLYSGDKLHYRRKAYSGVMARPARGERACPYMWQEHPCGLICDGESGEFCRRHDAAGQREQKLRVAAREQGMQDVLASMREDIAAALPTYLRTSLQRLYDAQEQLVAGKITPGLVMVLARVVKVLIEGEVFSMQVEESKLIKDRLRATSEPLQLPAVYDDEEDDED